LNHFQEPLASVWRSFATTKRSFIQAEEAVNRHGQVVPRQADDPFKANRVQAQLLGNQGPFHGRSAFGQTFWRRQLQKRCADPNESIFKRLGIGLQLRKSH
jgi:hypothetical protein